MQEVLVVEDENGEVVKEHLKDVEVRSHSVHLFVPVLPPSTTPRICRLFPPNIHFNGSVLVFRPIRFLIVPRLPKPLISDSRLEIGNLM
jgi:hypothetical protein